MDHHVGYAQCADGQGKDPAVVELGRDGAGVDVNRKGLGGSGEVQGPVDLGDPLAGLRTEIISGDSPFAGLTSG
ncbi:hypothetical protein ABIB27_001756 [Arthrobacter sp. UYEF21]